MLTRVIPTLVFIPLVLLMQSCTKAENPPRHEINPKIISQVESLSLSGSNQASVVFKTGEIKLTTDGGRTWQVIPSAAVGSDLAFAKMIDVNRGWAANRRAQVFRTDTGGASWTQVSGLKDITGVGQIEFVNENNGWMREFLSVWRTRDGGATWQETLSTVTPGVSGQPSAMFVINENTVVSSGNSGQVYLTVDGGKNWKIQSPLSGQTREPNFRDVWFVDKKHGWVTGDLVVVAGESMRPVLLETTDGGESWKEMPVNADILPSSVCFIGEEGWLAGSRRIVKGKSIELPGVLLRTEDGGKHWTPVQIESDEPFLTTVRFADKIHGWLVGRDSVYRTEDGGKSWQRVLTLPPVQ